MQLGSFLKKILKCDNGDLSRSEFLEAVYRYLHHRKDLVSKEFSKFCKCGGKPEFITGPSIREFSPGHAEAIGLQQKELEVRIYIFSSNSRSFESSHLIESLNNGSCKRIFRMYIYIYMYLHSCLRGGSHSWLDSCRKLNQILWKQDAKLN